MIRLKLLVALLFYCTFIPLTNASVWLTEIHGEHISFASLRGKWVLINYWASWCHPCLDEIAELNKFYHTKKERAAIFAVNFDYLPVQDQLELIKRLNIRYPSLLEDPASQLGLEHVRGVPATFVFDPEGNLSTILYGSQTLNSLNQAISDTSV